MWVSSKPLGAKTLQMTPKKKWFEILDLRAYSKLREKTTSVPSSCTNFKGAMTIAWSCVDPGWLDNHLFLLYVKLEEPPFFIGIYHPKGSPHCFKKGGWLPGFFSKSNRLRKIPKGPCKIWAAAPRDEKFSGDLPGQNSSWVQSHCTRFVFYHFVEISTNHGKLRIPCRDVVIFWVSSCQPAFFFSGQVGGGQSNGGRSGGCFHRFRLRILREAPHWIRLKPTW